MRWSPSLLSIMGFVLVWSGIAPIDRSIWVAEVLALPAAFLVWTMAAGGRFVRSPSMLTQYLMTVLIVMHLIGGRYTYQEVPLFEDVVPFYFGALRNHYDRVAHFVQGMALAISARECFVSKIELRRAQMVTVFSLAIVLAFANLCEQYEWVVCEVIRGQHGIEYLGAQGDDFDTQKDMFMAMVGGVLALILFRGVHDRQLSPTEGS